MTQRFSASSAAKLMSCPGSANLEKAIPGWVPPVQDDSKWKARGTGDEIHLLLKEFGEIGLPLLDAWIDLVTEFEKLHKNKRVLICDDLIECLTWINAEWGILATEVPRSFVTLMPRLREYPPKTLRFIRDAGRRIMELRMEMADDELFFAEEQLIAEWTRGKSGTTPDVTIVGPNKLIVIDYKTGSIPVDAVNNDQGLFYAATKYFGTANCDPDEVTIMIMQPDHFTEWTFPIEILGQWAMQALTAEKKIIDGDLTLVPSSHCTFCPANPHARGEKGTPLCPAQRAILYPQTVDEDEILNM